MFMTTIAYDFFKSFVTVFVEINGDDAFDHKTEKYKTMFGTPNKKILVPLVNLVAVLESVLTLIFEIFVIVHLSVRQFNLFYVMIPLYIWFPMMFVAMTVIYVAFVICMFMYASCKWRIILTFILPLGYINIVLFFGFPIIWSIMLPITRETKLVSPASMWYSTVYFILALVGSLLKGFIKPTEDDKNVFANQKQKWFQVVAYFLFVLLGAIFLLLATFATDRRFPFGNLPFDLNWWVVWIPAFIVQFIGMILFIYKAVDAIKSLVKNKGALNGDEKLKAVTSILLIIFLVVILVAQILTIVRLNDAKLKLNASSTLIPLPIAQALIVIATVLPFFPFFQKVYQEKGGAEGGKKKKKSAVKEREKEEEKKDDDDDEEDEYEMLTYL